MFIVLIASCSKSSLRISDKEKVNFKWTCINVNQRIQGDAHYIELENGENILIDAGYKEEGTLTLIPLFKKNNITKIDHFFLSHYHVDHYSGLIELLEQKFIIKNFYSAPISDEKCASEPWGCNVKDVNKLKNLLAENKVKQVEIKSGMNFQWGKINLKILYANNGIAPPDGAIDINGMSIVMQFTDGKIKYLFTGDLDEKVGSFLANQGDFDMESDILKIPHHGADAHPPKEFFEKVKAKDYIVPATKDLWCSERDKVMRKYVLLNKITTYISGHTKNITIASDGEKWTITPENKKPLQCSELVK